MKVTIDFLIGLPVREENKKVNKQSALMFGNRGILLKYKRLVVSRTGLGKHSAC
jgi:hypothetical protein